MLYGIFQSLGIRTKLYLISASNFFFVLVLVRYPFFRVPYLYRKTILKKVPVSVSVCFCFSFRFSVFLFPSVSVSLCTFQIIQLKNIVILRKVSNTTKSFSYKTEYLYHFYSVYIYAIFMQK